MGAVVAGINGVSTLEDQGVGTVGENERFGGEGIVVELVEVAVVCEFLGCPDSFQAFDEFSTASVVRKLVSPINESWNEWGGPITLSMFKPPLSNAGEFCLEPSRNHVD